MITEASRIDYSTTDSETDALILEYCLIREHMPRYNSQYIRKQVFQYIIVDTTLDYPTLYISEAPPNSASPKTFGCFHSSGDAHTNLYLLNDVWKTPLCNKPRFPTPAKPCMNYHINKCCAPCGARISREDYASRIGEILTCFSGDCGTTLERLKGRMLRYSGDLDFERAARVKAQLDGITALGMKARRIEASLEDKQVCLFLSAYNEPAYSLYFIRYGKVLVKERFPDKSELCATRLENFAKNLNPTPDEALPFPPTQALLHIAADKLFTPIPPVSEKRQIVEILRRGHRVFIREEN